MGFVFGGGCQCIDVEDGVGFGEWVGVEMLVVGLYGYGGVFLIEVVGECVFDFQFFGELCFVEV